MAQYDIKAVESEINKFWKKIKVKELLKKQNSKGKPYFLLDGPPFANNEPHIGHVRNLVLKDLYIRQAGMRGRNILFKPGFDTHGLPIENLVEKKLKFKTKQDILKYGIEKFVKECKNNAIKYKDIWMDVYETLGSYYENEVPYITFDNSYIESTWWSFKKIWDKGLVYEGQRPVMWCPKCETSLAGYESTDTYKMVTDPAVYVKFKLKDEDSYLLVFTTTPWTLPGNVGIAVHPEKDYVAVKTDKGNLILAKKRLELLDRIKLKYKVVKTMKGKTLVGKSYEPLLKLPQQEELEHNPNAHKIIASIPLLKERIASKTSTKKGIKAKDVFEDFVTDEDGTGLVHTAPGHGKTDNVVGTHYDMPAVSPLDSACNFTELAGKYQGMFVKDADHVIMEDMYKVGSLLHYEKIQHKYPSCWRCKSPLIYKMSNQWFINVEPFKKQMLEANETVVWQPEFAKDRMRHWLANIEDWNFSRQRFWGIPIPIWKSEDGDYIVLGSAEEFRKLTGAPKSFDLHAVSEKTIKKNGKVYTRIKDIFDVWYDSGSSPYASMHYPFENKTQFEKHFPIDRIVEAQDQIRGWFYSLLACSMGSMNKLPYKTVSMPAWVTDDKGEKLSKSLGNYIGANEGLDKLGADIIRFYYCWETAPYAQCKFNAEVVRTEVYRFFNILWNLHEFVLKEEFKINAKPKEVEDKWIMSRLNTVISKVHDGLDSFEVQNAGRELYNFVVEDLSRKYVKVSRERSSEDTVPFSMIYQVIKKVIVMLTPIAPFISEKIYQNFKVKEKLKESVQLELLPKASIVDKKLEKEFEEIFDVISTVLAARDLGSVGLRWPLPLVTIETNYELSKYEELIKAQTNIKELKYKKIKLDYSLKPNFRNIGKKLGQNTAPFIEKFKKHEESMKKELKKGVKYKGVTITLDDFSVENKIPKNNSFAEGKQVKVLLNLESTPALEKEGLLRELLRRVQMLRKIAGLEKKDKIKLKIDAEVMKEFEKEILMKTNASSIIWTDKITGKYKSQFTVKKHEFTFSFQNI